VSGQKEFIQSVRLPDQYVAALLEMLDESDRLARADLRKFKRSSYRTRKLVIHVLDENQNIESSFRVVARNLSVAGMAFIHGQMLRPGKLVMVQIPHSHGEGLTVLARVAHCRHVDGMIHEAGLRFVGPGKPSLLAQGPV
jgi:hypothetical protein